MQVQPGPYQELLCSHAPLSHQFTVRLGPDIDCEHVLASSGCDKSRHTALIRESNTRGERLHYNIFQAYLRAPYLLFYGTTSFWLFGPPRIFPCICLSYVIVLSSSSLLANRTSTTFRAFYHTASLLLELCSARFHSIHTTATASESYRQPHPFLCHSQSSAVSRSQPPSTTTCPPVMYWFLAVEMIVCA